MNRSTIAAISTPPGSGGIGIIKISGPKAIPLARSLFVPGRRPFKGRCFVSGPLSTPVAPRKLVYGHIVDPETRQIVDEVLLAVMPAPHSYTAEDVVEIQAHAGPLILKTILSLLVKHGAELAQPGEFTKRAFLNGRIDLTQAEAVLDMISARSARALDMAVAQLSGGLMETIHSLEADLIAVLSSLEASIDFPDDLEADMDMDQIAARIETGILARIKELMARYDAAHVWREGFKAVIMGRPNVGKSSLLNRLVSRDRAIVTEFPGTTRDLIEDSFIAKGIPVIVTDTAGIHESSDPVERIGIQKAWRQVSQADVVLYVVDAGMKVTADDICIIERLRGKTVILVINKTDLPLEKKVFEIPVSLQHLPCMEVSALTNHGIEALKDLMATFAFQEYDCKEHAVVPNLRHQTALQRAARSLERAAAAARNSSGLALMALDLRAALDALAEITGKNNDEAVLDYIFNQFCIGK